MRTHTHFNALSLTETESLVVSLNKHIHDFPFCGYLSDDKCKLYLTTEPTQIQIYIFKNAV